jgi:hypothetical protein
MVFRSFISTAFFSALFSWIQYRLQWQSMNNLAVYFDGVLMSNNPEVGNYRSVMLSGVLAANKTLLGYIIIAGLAFMTFIMFHHFGKLKYKVVSYHVKKSSRNILINNQIDEELIEDIEAVAGSIG